MGWAAPKMLASAVAATRLGRSFEHEDFWQTVLHFFVNEPTLDPLHVGPIVDYLNDQRFVPQEIFTEERDLGQPGPPPAQVDHEGTHQVVALEAGRGVADAASLRIRLPGLVLALRCDLAGVGRMTACFGLDQRQVVGQRLQEKVLVLDRHRRPDMDLNRQNAFELPSLLVEINDVHRHVAVDPVPVMVPFGQDPVVVPFVGRRTP